MIRGIGARSLTSPRNPCSLFDRRLRIRPRGTQRHAPYRRLHHLKSPQPDLASRMASVLSTLESYVCRADQDRVVVAVMEQVPRRSCHLRHQVITRMRAQARAAPRPFVCLKLEPVSISKVQTRTRTSGDSEISQLRLRPRPRLPSPLHDLRRPELRH